MKKFLFILSAGVVCLLTSCSSKKEDGGASAQSKKNIESVNAINTAIETGDVSKLGDIIATDGIDHSGMEGEVKGLDAIKAELGAMKDQMDGMKFTSINTVADDEYVYQWVQFTATCKMDMGPMKKGDKIDSKALELTKFNKEGKATDHWEFMTRDEFMKMMPPMPAGDKPVKDTAATKM